MASSVTSKQPCVKCDKGGGVAVCSGCQQWFCTKHFNEHRQELAIEMDSLGEEHDLLQRDLSENDNAHDLLSSVNDWEQKSIAKIQAAAEQVRMDIRKYLDDNKQRMKLFLGRVTGELKLNRQSDDYTEIDLKKWLEQLKEIRQMLDKPSNIHIIEDNDPQSTIHLIQVQQTEIMDRTEYGMYHPICSQENSQRTHSTEDIKNHKNDKLQPCHICRKCDRKFSTENNHRGDCVHSGTWHAKYEDCSYLKCGFHLGIKASIGRQHWSCCYSLERESNRCSESEPHMAV